MKKINIINIIIILSIIFASPIFSQSTYFSKIFARAFPFYGSISSVVALKDKGFVFLLDMQDYKNDTNTVNIIRVSAKGDTIWNVEHKFEKKDAIYISSCMVEVEDDNFLISGQVLIKDSTLYTQRKMVLG